MKINEIISINENGYKDDAISIITDLVIRFYEMKKKKVPLSYFSQQLSERGIDLTDEQIIDLISDMEQVSDANQKEVKFGNESAPELNKFGPSKKELNKERISKVAKNQAQKDLG